MYPDAVLAPTTGVRGPRGARFARGALLVLFTYIFLANDWMGDDAHITFRSVWNFVHGYGLTYNPDERVQAYTHPLWMMAISVSHLLTGEFFFTVTALSWIFDVAAGVVLLRRTATVGSAVLLTLWLLSSKALVDYTSSGLEYPLSYFLIAIFYAKYFARPIDAPPDWRDSGFRLVSALAFVNRADAVLLFAVPVAEMTLRRLFVTRGKRSDGHHRHVAV